VVVDNHFLCDIYMLNKGISMSHQVNDIRLIIRNMLAEGSKLVGASEEYIKGPEAARQQLQDLATNLVASGEISTDEELREFFETIEQTSPAPHRAMAAMALKHVPLLAFQQAPNK